MQRLWCVNARFGSSNEKPQSLVKSNILKDVQDDVNIHFCQDTVENIN